MDVLARGFSCMSTPPAAVSVVVAAIFGAQNALKQQQSFNTQRHKEDMREQQHLCACATRLRERERSAEKKV
jgi:hypothetical protein